MTWLRPILLLAGILFIFFLAWWERRRTRQAATPKALRTERQEPSLDSAPTESAPAEAPPERERPGAAPDSRNRELHRSPPVIDWENIPNAAPGTPDPAVAPMAPAEPPPDLIVDWPAEDTRRIVTLRILPARQDRLAGRDLRQGLAACGFRHGQFGIFHLAREDGRVLISAASLVRPGMLDPTTMDFQRFAGINVFAVFPGPESTEATLQRLSQVAVEVAARVGGRIQDENSAPFEVADTTSWRRRCLDLIEGAQPGARTAD